MNLFNNKYFLILISACIALLIWLYAASLKEQTAVVSLPVQFINIPSDFHSFNLPLKAKFKVTGSGFDIVKLILSGFQIQYDASEMDNVNSQIDEKHYIINDIYTAGISSIEAITDNIAVQYEAIIIANVPIELDFRNKDARQKFNATNFKLSRDEVEIKGPENLVRSVSAVKTEPLSTNLLNKNKFNIKLVPPSKQVELLASSVDLTQIDEQHVSKVITRVQITYKGELDFFPREISVRISGNPSLLKNVNKADILAELVVSKEVGGDIPISVKVPKDVEILDYSPDKVNRLSHEK